MQADILDYYLRRFEEKGNRSRLAGRRRVGMEAKFCLTDSHGKAVSGEQLEGFFGGLAARGWRVEIDGNLGVSIGAVKEFPMCPAAVATGTGHCKIEFSVPHGRTLQELERNFGRMVEDASGSLRKMDVYLLCLGVHPVTEPHPGLVQRKKRHIFWDRVFSTGLVYLFAISADCQAHVDIEPGEVRDAVNVLQGLAGAQIALTANATIWKQAVDEDHLDVREAFWDWWLPDSDRVGVARRPFASLEHYVDHIASMRPVFVERRGKSLGIYAYENFKEYYHAGGGAKAVTPEGDSISIQPLEKDIDLHDTFNWSVARLSRYCTIENRVNCQQPPEDIMTVPALTLGLVENLAEGVTLLEGYDWGVLRTSRRRSLMQGPGMFVEDPAMRELCRGMLQVAQRGLVARGEGEERFLAPLWDRLESASCPALEARRLFLKGGITALLERYAL